MPQLELDFLRHFNMPPAWIRRIEETMGNRFLPVQEKAIREGGLLEGNNLLVCGPTSCGKGLVGDLACLHGVLRDRPGILVVPTKALARQRQAELRQRYGPLGLHVVQSSRDRREADKTIVEGRYHLAVVVAEKLLTLLTQSPHLFAPVGAVVFDELQMVFDEDRGADLELLVTRLLREEALQIVALSAVIEQPGPIAEWLGARLVEETERPVELRQGVLCPGSFHYREFNRGQDGEEHLAEIEGESEEELIYNGVLHFARQGEMTLVFCATKDESFAWADRFASALALPAAEESLEELEGLEDNLATDTLRRLLASQVAVHNADLTWPQRQLVEKYAARGDIRVLCSTSTLSEGVNLPIANTFIPRSIYRTRSEDLLRGRPPRPEKLTRSRFRNMTGRSGRFGQANLPLDNQGQPFGRGILVSPHEGDVETLKRVYLDPDQVVPRPQLLGYQLPQLVLKLIATGSAQSEKEIEKFLQDSLSGRMAVESGVSIQEQVSVAIEALKREKFLKKTARAGLMPGSDALQINAWGELAARRGVSPETLMHFRSFIRSADSFQDLEVLLVVATSAEGRLAHLPLSRGEWKSRCYVRELYRRLAEDENDERPLLKSLFDDEDSSDQGFAVILKKVLLLADWISTQPTLEVEHRFRVLSGQIEKLADHFSWLVEVLAEATFLEQWPQEQTRRIELLGRQLKAGLPASALGLGGLYERGLNRSALLQLNAVGLDSVDEVEEIPRAELVRVLGRAQAALLDKQEEVPITPVNGVDEMEIQTGDENKNGHEICLSGRMSLMLNRLRPDRAIVNKQEISLTSREFDLLWTLAENAGECVLYDTILDRVWQDVIVEQHQALSLKSRLLKKIRPLCKKGQPDLIMAIRGKGLVLDL